MIQTIQKRIRPRFGMDDLLLHRETGELSYLPDEYAPHTITAFLDSKRCRLVFEYSTDETAGYPMSPDPTVRILFGKYTQKVLTVMIEFTTRLELIQRLAFADQWLIGQKQLLSKESYRKNYDLACAIINNFIIALNSDSELISQFSE